MPFKIPEEKISEIKNSVNIVEVISEIVRLKKTGKNFIGLCPFHSEKTPSFTVSPDKQIFHCFGCGEGGNVISFLMKHENLSFLDAVKMLAKRFSIELPTGSSSVYDQKKTSERERLLTINRQARDFFVSNLNSADSGEIARRYLEARGIKKSVIEKFHLGYAPEGWSRLSDFFSRKNIPVQLPEKTGLVVFRKNKNGTYDRFRNRIIFPISDITGQVIGFGGRNLNNEDLPKYLNSPETGLYTKRRTLYALNIAKKHCREKNSVYVVEGYLDCITLHQYGLENTIATLGTALTPEHIRLLRGYADKIVLVFDSDEAGIKAAVRSVPLFTEQGVDARVMVLPVGHDPDSYVRQYGHEKFIRLSLNAAGIITFLIDSEIKKHGITVEGKIRIISELVEPLAGIEDPVARSVYIKEVSERLDIDEAPILMKIKEQTGRPRIQNQKNRAMGRVPLQEDNPVNDHQHKEDNQWIRSERRIIAMMLQFSEIIPDIERYNVLNYFKDELLKSIGMIILENKQKHEQFVSDIINNIKDDEKKKVVSELAISDEAWEYKGCIKLIHKFMVTARSDNEKLIMNQIKAAEESNDEELLLKLLMEKQKNAIFTEKQKMTIINGE